MPARISPNGATQITPRDQRLGVLVQPSMADRDISYARDHARGDTQRAGAAPSYTRPPPRAYRTTPGGHQNGQGSGSASVWSSEPVADDEGVRAKLRAALQ